MGGHTQYASSKRFSSSISLFNQIVLWTCLFLVVPLRLALGRAENSVRPLPPSSSYWDNMNQLILLTDYDWKFNFTIFMSIDLYIQFIIQIDISKILPPSEKLRTFICIAMNGWGSGFALMGLGGRKVVGGGALAGGGGSGGSLIWRWWRWQPPTAEDERWQWWSSWTKLTNMVNNIDFRLHHKEKQEKLYFSYITRKFIFTHLYNFKHFNSKLSRQNLYQIQNTWQLYYWVPNTDKAGLVT